MDKRNFLAKLRNMFPNFKLTLGKAKYADGESVFVDGSAIPLACDPPSDKWDSQSLELLYPDYEKHVQETSYKVAKENRQA